ncbi:MAG TPA: bleomycin resistance family protein [Bacteroidetes bacterium]|nr:bleomycin resistance family protein [Bacteroidota bacterium]
MMKKLTPNIMVNDVNATVPFYKDVLGFEMVMSVPETGLFDWALLRAGSVEIMLQSTSSLTRDLPEFNGKPAGGTLIFYIDVKDVRQLHASVKGKVAITKEMQKTFYGTEEFTIKDPNGYYLTFAGGGE